MANNLYYLVELEHDRDVIGQLSPDIAWHVYIYDGQLIAVGQTELTGPETEKCDHYVWNIRLDRWEPHDITLSLSDMDKKAAEAGVAASLHLMRIQEGDLIAMGSPDWAYTLDCVDDYMTHQYNPEKKEMGTYLDENTLTEADRNLLEAALLSGLRYADICEIGQYVSGVNLLRKPTSTHVYLDTERRWKGLDK